VSSLTHNPYRPQPRLSKRDGTAADRFTLSCDGARVMKYANQVALGTGRHSKHIYS
jgi:hypothetical protein